MSAPPVVGATGSRGVLSLVFGILSVLGFSILTGIPAWIIAHGYIKEVEAGRTDPAELGMAKAGKILGMVSVVLGVIGLVMFAPIYILLVSMLSGIGPANTYRVPPSEIHRQKLADAIAKERKAHAQSYTTLAKKLTDANGKHLDWYSQELTPSPGCGTYSFKAENGSLVIADGCGSTTLSGWPAQIQSQ